MKIKSTLTIAALGLLLLAGCNTGNVETPSPSSQGIDPVVLTEENFDQIVLSSTIPVLVDFGAEW